MKISHFSILHIILAVIGLLCLFWAKDNWYLLRYNKLTAKLEMALGQAKILTMGANAGDRHDLEITTKYGFYYKRVAGCDFPEDLDESADNYNGEVERLLEQRNGTGWKERMEEELDSVHIARHELYQQLVLQTKAYDKGTKKCYHVEEEFGLKPGEAYQYEICLPEQLGVLLEKLGYRKKPTLQVNVFVFIDEQGKIWRVGVASVPVSAYHYAYSEGVLERADRKAERIIKRRIKPELKKISPVQPGSYLLSLMYYPMQDTLIIAEEKRKVEQ